MAGNKLLALIKDVTLGEGKNVKEILNGDVQLNELLLLAEKHQMQHILGQAMMSLGDARLQDKFFTSFAVTKQQMQAAENISRALSEANIEHILLKGAVMRTLYPEEWMRNSCDVDILVREEEHARACDVLSDMGFEKQPVLTAHDMAFELAEAHIELHYRLIEDYRMKEVSDVLSGVWDDARPSGEDKFRLELSHEMFYFYHIAHAAKHFGDGGCGIRPVLDLYILRQKWSFDEERLREMLKQGGVDKFEKRLSEIAEHWFGDGAGDGLEFMEEYILSGGVYGNSDNRIAVMRERRGKLGYIISRLFPPRKYLSSGYPILEKHKCALPFVWIIRLVKAPFKKNTNYIAEITDTGNERDIHKMISDLGLSEFC